MATTTFEWLAIHGPQLSVGVLSADIMHLAEDIALLEKSGVGLLHFDVMDGRFAPQLTVGDAFVKSIKTSLLKDVHLMVCNPLDTIGAYVAAGADIVTVHAESGKHLHRCLQMLGEMKNVNDPQRGIVRGVALNPSTPLSAVEPLLDEVEFIVLLAVNPGFSGQKFINSTVSRFQQVKAMVQTHAKKILMGIDGGITRATIGQCAQFKADIVVSGSAIFEKRQLLENISVMKELLHGK